MAAAVTATKAARPREDDVVIIQGNDQWQFGLSLRPASLQARTYESVLAVLDPFARSHGVDVWVAHDGGASFELVIAGRTIPLSHSR